MPRRREVEREIHWSKINLSEFDYRKLLKMMVSAEGIEPSTY